MRDKNIFYYAVIALMTVFFAAMMPGTALGSDCYVDTSRIPVVKYCPAGEENYVRDYRGKDEINYIVIHTVQGSLTSAINTFASSNLSYPRSAHYTVGLTGEVVKSVPARWEAWHAGTSPLASGGKHESRVLNENSIGIEHEGYVDGERFPTKEQYLTSAGLTRYLCELYDIPMDRDHIVGHDEIKSTKGDPGQNWDWDYYLELVRRGTTERIYVKEAEPTSDDSSGKSQSILGQLMIAAGVAVTVIGYVVASK